MDKDGEPIFERDVRTIANNQIYLPTKDELNDPTEGFVNDSAITAFFEQYKQYSSKVKQRYGGLIREKFQNIGIYSLSRRNDDELLWAYYASGHTGFAIEYNIDRLKESLNHNQHFQFVFDLDVEYAENVPNPDIFDLRGNDVIDTLRTYLGAKSLSWNHEKEYRLIFEGKGLFEIDYRAVTGIYFGCRMQEPQIDFIMEKLKGRGLTYYQMRLVGKTYKFEPKEIEDRYFDTPKYCANSVEYDIDGLLASGGMSKNNIDLYRDKFVTALEGIKNDPLITGFYIATMDLNSEEPAFLIFANTKSGIPPTKEFKFRLDDKGEVYRLK